MNIKQLLDSAASSGNHAVQALGQLVQSSTPPAALLVEDLPNEYPALVPLKKCLEAAVNADKAASVADQAGPSAGSSAIMDDGATTIVIKEVPADQPFIGEGVWEVVDQYGEKHIVERSNDGSWAVVWVESRPGETWEREYGKDAEADAAAPETPVALKDLEITKTVGLTINAPHYFRRPDFMAWLNDPEKTVFSYHKKGNEVAHEYSDTIVLVDSYGEGDSSDMPEDIWQEICQIAYQAYGGAEAPSRLGSHIAVRLTNLAD